jgi:hypothetical protein
MGKRGTADIIGRVEKCYNRYFLLPHNPVRLTSRRKCPMTVPLRNSSTMRCPDFNFVAKGTGKRSCQYGRENPPLLQREIISIEWGSIDDLQSSNEWQNGTDPSPWLV